MDSLENSLILRFIPWRSDGIAPNQNGLNPKYKSDLVAMAGEMSAILTQERVSHPLGFCGLHKQTRSQAFRIAGMIVTMAGCNHNHLILAVDLVL